MSAAVTRRQSIELSMVCAAALAASTPFETEEGYLFASDLNTPRRFETLAERLLDRGHGEARVEKILGGNLLRVSGETWASAA